MTTDRSGTQALYQVSLELRGARTREREVRALTTAMQETKIEQGTILSLDAEEQIETDAGLIEILPAWLWVVR